MKSHHRWYGILFGSIVAFVLAAGPVRGQATPASDAAWAELQSLGLLQKSPSETEKALPSHQRYERQETRALQLREKGQAFIAAFPHDPRRWSVALQMILTPPNFVVSYGSDENFRDLKTDHAAEQAWNVKLAELESAMHAATDLPADVREVLDRRDLQKQIMAFYERMRHEPTLDWTPVTQALGDLAAKYPASDESAQFAHGFMYSFESSHSPAESAAVWQKFAVSPNAKLAGIARDKLRAFAAITAPQDLAFTALGGREVDLKKLRGKVVLIDFWATWCGPCMMEMPNVKKVYAAYHDQGFEIVGVSCDVAPENASTPSWKKIARTGPQVLAFTQQHDMPWPEYYDGHKHNAGGNVLAARFGVDGIPASLLVDRSGQVVALNLRGQELDAAVQRLLKP